jgi:hypothetical protein
MVKTRDRSPHVRGRSPGARGHRQPRMSDDYDAEEPEWEPAQHDQQYRKAATGFYQGNNNVDDDDGGAIIETVFRKPKEFADLHEYDDIPLIDRVPTAVGFHSLDSADPLNEERSRVSRYELDQEDEDDDEDEDEDYEDVDERHDVEERRRPRSPQYDSDDDIDDKYSKRAPADSRSVWSESTDSCPPMWRSYSDGDDGKDWATYEAKRRRDLSEAKIPIRKSKQEDIQQISPEEQEFDRKRQQVMQERKKRGGNTTLSDDHYRVRPGPSSRDPPAEGRESPVHVKVERILTRAEIAREHPTTSGATRSGQVPIRRTERIISRSKSTERKRRQPQQQKEQVRPSTESVKSGSAKIGSVKSGSAKSGSAKSGSAKSGSAKSGSTKSGSAKKGSVREESVKNESLKSGSNRSSSVKKGSVREESVKNDSLKSGSNRSSSVKRGSVKEESVKNDSVKSGSNRSSSVKRGSVREESVKTDSVKSGSAKERRSKRNTAEAPSKPSEVEQHHESEVEQHPEIEIKKKQSKNRLPKKPVTESKPSSASKKEKEAGESARSEKSGKSIRSWLVGSKMSEKSKKSLETKKSHASKISKASKESKIKSVEKKSSVSNPPKAEASEKKTGPPSARKEEKPVRSKKAEDAPPAAKAEATAKSVAPSEKGTTKKSEPTKLSKVEEKSPLDHESASTNTKSTGGTSEKPDPTGSVSLAEPEPDWLDDKGGVKSGNGMDAVEFSRNPEPAQDKPLGAASQKEPAFVAGLRNYSCDTLASTFMAGINGLAHFGIIINVDEKDASLLKNSDVTRSPGEDESVVDDSLKLLTLDGWDEEKNQRPLERTAATPKGRDSRRKNGRRNEEDAEEGAAHFEESESTPSERKQNKRGDDRSRETDSKKRDKIKKREEETREAVVGQRIKYQEGDRNAGRPDSRGSRSRNAGHSPHNVQRLEERSLQLDGQDEDEEEFDTDDDLVERVAETRKRELDKQVAQVFVPDSPKDCCMSISTIEIPTPMASTAYQLEDDGCSVSILGLEKKKRSSRKKERQDEAPLEEGEEMAEKDQIPPVIVQQLKKGKPSFIGKFLARKKSTQ